MSLSLYNFINNKFSQIDVCGLLDKQQVLRFYGNLANCATTCSYLMNWEVGMRYLESFLRDESQDMLEFINSTLGELNDILANTDEAIDIWNEFTELYQVDITFSKIQTPLEKFLDSVNAAGIIGKLQDVQDLSSSERVELLNEIIELADISKIKILSAYLTNSLELVSEGLRSIEEIKFNKFIELGALASDCDQLMRVILDYPYEDVASIGKLKREMRKRRGKR